MSHRRLERYQGRVSETKHRRQLEDIGRVLSGQALELSEALVDRLAVEVPELDEDQVVRELMVESVLENTTTVLLTEWLKRLLDSR